MSKPYPDDWPDIDIKIYDRSVKIFRTIKKMLSVNMMLHAEDQVQQGDIFLFNHFSRFETFIPQFLIYEQSGAYSCAIAAAEFFKEENILTKYLKNVGVFPHDHQRLFALLAEQIFRGRKVIIFPEGGMIKDRRVLDNCGRYRIFSRVTGDRRKQHTGAAVLAQGIEAFKAMLRNAYCNKNFAQLELWKQQLNLDSMDQLLMTALKPTLIVPANITFYPIRSSENLLLKGVELMTRGLSYRQTEELLVEGNIILKNTDMDLRMGTPVDPYQTWHWWNRYILELVNSEFKTLDDVFALHTAPANWKQKLLGAYFRKNADATRNQYMKDIYANMTINLSHLAASLIMHGISRGHQQIEKRRFYATLYIAIKHLQRNAEINLHRSLLSPNDYGNLLKGQSKGIEQFICVAKESVLVSETETHFHYLPKLCEEYDLDTIRLENLIAVYNNEAAPIQAVRNILIQAYEEAGKLTPKQLAAWFFEDEKLSLHWEKKYYTKPRYEDINQQEKADADASPFLLQPVHQNGTGVLLIHGLLASPAELKTYGNYLSQQGYTVLAVRLKGHGTSPYALREQYWEDWFESVQRGHKILSAYCDQIFVTGFSTGGALALKLAAENHANIIGVVAASVPLGFKNRAFMLVPLLHGTNKLVRWTSTFEGIKPFIQNAPEHPHINYQNVPVRALYELRRLIQHMDEFLPKVTTPALILYADEDPVIDPQSASDLMAKIAAENKRLMIINASHHGILMNNTGDIWQSIHDFYTETTRQRENQSE